MHTNIQPMHIGQVIREIREARKATLEEVAFAANTNASNLSRIERAAKAILRRRWSASPKRLALRLPNCICGRKRLLGRGKNPIRGTRVSELPAH